MLEYYKIHSPSCPMSRFFQSLDEEKQEVKKKTVELAERSQEKLSKREQKFKELTAKIDEMTNAGKNFEKLFKKFMNELKKQTGSFENNEVPTFIKDFFKDKRIQASSPMSSAVSEFMLQFEVQKMNTVEIKTASKKRGKTIEDVIGIEDENDRERELRVYLEKSDDGSGRCEALTSLFSIYSKREDATAMIETLGQIDLSDESSHARNACERIDVYLGRIFRLLIKSADDDAVTKYKELLISLKKSEYPLSKAAVEARILELEFVKQGSEMENDHPIFRLLYLTRRGKWEEALEHFEGNREALEIGEANKMRFSTVLALSEFAKLAVSAGKLELGLSTYLKCTESGVMNFKLEIYALCIALCDRPIVDECFQDFLEFFKHFDANYLCLRSHDPFIEMSRAFYYLNVLDFVTASGIIEGITGFQLHNRLEEIVTGLYQRKYVS